jgi:hypothetical protein
MEFSCKGTPRYYYLTGSLHIYSSGWCALDITQLCSLYFIAYYATHTADAKCTYSPETRPPIRLVT